MRLLTTVVLFFAIGLTAVDRLPAQHMPKEEYYRYVPLEVPRLIRQTPASERLQLFGDPSDPGFRDQDPMDGIDDRRFQILQRLAVRFAPLMVLNTTSVPMAIGAFAESEPTFPLYVDTWNTAAPGGVLVNEEAIDFKTVATDPCQPLERMAGNSRKADCRLLELLHEFDPEQPSSAFERTAARESEQELFKVMYFDFPGYDPASWKREYQTLMSRRLPGKYHDFLRTYVHPFIIETRGVDGPLYELVLQYWFFYPTNDGGNNHEGDWEHINVVITPLSAVTRALTAGELARVLEGDPLNASRSDDPLVIRRIEHYFHSKVMTLDFSAPNVYASRDEWERQVNVRVQERESENWFWKMIRWRAYEDKDETRINTHPIVHIGADNKGTDQVLSMPGGTNRDSHGSFPFAGLYKDVGPAGAAENVSTFFDHQKFLAETPERQAELLSEFKRGSVVSLADVRHVEIVPDWERVIELVKTDVQARAEWSWLVLPLRFGYPAVESPFAGVVAHAETGNLSVVGPAFNSGWNRAGVTDQYAAYDPHKVPRLLPLGWVDNFQNSWGFLNLTLPTLAFLPPVDVLWRVVALPLRIPLGRQDPTFYPQDNIPFRFLGFTGGVSWMEIPADYTDLLINSAQFNEIVARLLVYTLANGSENTVAVGGGDFAEDATVPFYQSSFFVGSRFASQTMLRHSRTDIGATVEFSDIPDPFVINGELNFWELAGSLRYSLAKGGLQPYGKAGYGWSWYRIENVATNGELLETPNSVWVRKPSIIPLENLLPNTWHIGAGVEFIVIKTYGTPPGGIDFSVRGEWTLYTNDLGLDATDLPLETLLLLGYSAEDVPQDRWITRSEWKLGATLSF